MFLICIYQLKNNVLTSYLLPQVVPEKVAHTQKEIQNEIKTIKQKEYRKNTRAQTLQFDLKPTERILLYHCCTSKNQHCNYGQGGAVAIVIFCFQAKKYTKIKTLSRGRERKSQKEKSPTMKIAENNARIYLELFFYGFWKKTFFFFCSSPLYQRKELGCGLSDVDWKWNQSQSVI